MFTWIYLILILLPGTGCTADEQSGTAVGIGDTTIEKIVKTDKQWREELSAREYHILREKGTEKPYTGQYVDFKGEGTYHCAGCGHLLFYSKSKYNSRTGWPSFYEPATGYSIFEKPDHSYRTVRTEVVCARCESHLGHVFTDGPPPTELRYCINSLALDFSSER